MHSRFAVGLGSLVALLASFALSASADANIIGLSVTATSQVNAGSIENRSDAAIDPGAEIQHGDSNDFNWMIPGDSIDYQPYPNVAAPNSVYISLAKDHTFSAGDVLHLSFELPAPYTFGVAAITQAITVNQIVASIAGNKLSMDISDMTEVSQGDFGGAVRVIFSIVPEPASAMLLAAGMVLAAVRRRRSR